MGLCTTASDCPPLVLSLFAVFLTHPPFPLHPSILFCQMSWCGCPGLGIEKLVIGDLESLLLVVHTYYNSAFVRRSHNPKLGNKQSAWLFESEIEKETSANRFMILFIPKNGLRWRASERFDPYLIRVLSYDDRLTN